MVCCAQYILSDRFIATPSDDSGTTLPNHGCFSYIGTTHGVPLVVPRTRLFPRKLTVIGLCNNLRIQGQRVIELSKNHRRDLDLQQGA